MKSCLYKCIYLQQLTLDPINLIIPILFIVCQLLGLWYSKTRTHFSNHRSHFKTATSLVQAKKVVKNGSKLLKSPINMLEVLISKQIINFVMKKGATRFIKKGQLPSLKDLTKFFKKQCVTITWAVLSLPFLRIFDRKEINVLVAFAF